MHHKNVPLEQIHKVCNWVIPVAADISSIAVTVDDVYKLAFATDTGLLYILKSVSPSVWSAIAGESVEAHVGQSDPHSQYVLSSEMGVPSGGATLTSDGRLVASQSPREFPDGWQDLLSETTVRTGGGSSAPTLAAIVGGIYEFQFSATAMNQTYHKFHIPHDYKAGSDVYIHCHFIAPGAGTGVCRFGFEVSIAKGYDRGAHSSTTTHYVQQATSSTPLSHSIAEIVLPGSGLELETDTVVLVRFFRDAAHASDTETQAVFVTYVDLHYMSSQDNTPNRNYPFA